MVFISQNMESGHCIQTIHTSVPELGILVTVKECLIGTFTADFYMVPLPASISSFKLCKVMHDFPCFISLIKVCVQKWAEDFTLLYNHNFFTLAKSQSKSNWLDENSLGASVQLPSSILLQVGKTNLLVHRLWSGSWKRRALKKPQPDSELRNRLLC